MFASKIISFSRIQHSHNYVVLVFPNYFFKHFRRRGWSVTLPLLESDRLNKIFSQQLSDDDYDDDDIDDDD